jgi:hypothetical protein
MNDKRLSAVWKLCSVTVFSTACDSASITSIMSTRRLFSFMLNQGNKVGWVRDDNHVIFGNKFAVEKKEE